MKRDRIGTGALIILALTGALAPVRALAITDEEIFRDFRFNFINPGAQALGLGGAAIASAVDATAAQSNPAALHYVTRQELFVEYRHVRPETQISNQRTGDNLVTNLALPYLNSTAVDNRDDSSLLSFMSYAFPFNIGPERCTLAVSRQIVLDVTTSLTDEDLNTPTSLSFSTDEFPIVVHQDDDGTARLRSYTVSNTVEGDLDAQLVHYNLGFSLSLGNDFSLGLTGTYATLDMRSDVTSTTVDPRGILLSANPRAQDADGSADILSRTRIDDSDAAAGYTLGLHWHPDSVFPSGLSPVQFGLVYRKGARLGVQETVCETDPTLGGACTETDRFENVLRVPDRAGLGISYKPRPWMFTADVERIRYSDLLDGFEERVNFFTSGRIPSDLLNIRDLRFQVDDATVVHAGVQYSFRSWGGWGQSLWAGYFNSPDNRIRLDEITVVPTDNTAPARLSARKVERLYTKVFGGGKDENHVTVGFAWTAPKAVTVQFAGDFSDETDQFLGSVLFHLGGAKR